MDFLTILDPINLDKLAYDRGILKEIKKFSLLKDNRIGWNYPMDYSFVAQQMEELLDQGRIKPGMKFVDIGCGPGAIHGYLENKYGIDILGIDMKRWGKDYVDVQGDFLNKSLRESNGIKENSVDGFISVSALEHLPTDMNKQVLAVCKDCLKPGGFIIATAAVSKEYNKTPDQTNYDSKQVEEIYSSKFQPFNYKETFVRWRNHHDMTPAFLKRYNKPELSPTEPSFLAFGYFYRKPEKGVKNPRQFHNIKDYKDLHKGGRCFVVGNGPSLKTMNLELMENDISIGMNRIALIYNSTNWRPSYYCGFTSNISNASWRTDVTSSVDKGIPSFIAADYQKFFPQPNVIFLRCTGHGDKMPSYPDKFWSYDLDKGVTKYGSTILVSIELAVYMGFKTIYLIGCDLGFKDNCQKSNEGSDKNHFSADYGTPGCPAPVLNHNMVQAHILAKRMAEKVGVTIYNATPGGNLEIYKRTNYKDLF